MYTLDNPYIHLSLAENLLRGHYGVNVDEVASPSSSILYPFLLAGTLAFGLGGIAPLFLNTLGAIGVSWLIAGFFLGRIGEIRHRSRVCGGIYRPPNPAPRNQRLRAGDHGHGKNAPRLREPCNCIGSVPLVQ